MPLFDDGIDLNNTLLRLARDKDGGFSPIVPGLGPTGSWTERFVEVFAQRQATGRTNYGLYPPKAESVWQIDDFSRGMGREFERTDPDLSFWYAGIAVGNGIDIYKDKVFLPPEFRTSATTTNTSGVLYKAYHVDSPSRLYAIARNASTSVGQVLTTTGDPAANPAPTWTEAGAFAATRDVRTTMPQNMAAVFQGTGESVDRLFLAVAGANPYQTSTSTGATVTLTENTSTSTPAADGFQVVGDELWRALSSSVYLSTNGTNAATWGTGIVIGDPRIPIRSMCVGLDNAEPRRLRLFVLKADGIHTVNAIGDAYDQHLTPQFHASENSNDGLFNALIRTHIIAQFHGKLWAYNYDSGNIIQIGPERLALPSPMPSMDLEGIVSRGDYLYAYYVDAAGAGRRRLLKAHVRFTPDGEIGSIAWWSIYVVAEIQGRGLFISQQTQGSSATNPFLMINGGDATTEGYFATLPRSGDDPTEDANSRYATTGQLYLPWFADLPGEDKVFMAVDLLARGLDATDTIDVQYITAAGGTYASMGTWNVAGDNDGVRKSFSSPPRSRGIGIRLDLTGSATTTAQLNRFELRFAFRVTPKRIWRATLDLTNSLTGDKTVEDLKTDLNTFANSGTLNMTDPEGVTRVILVDQNPYIALDTYVSQGGSTPVQRYLAVVEMIEAASGTTAGTALALAGAVTMQGNLDMANYIITNVGNALTDFNSSGGLTLASSLALYNPAATFTYTLTAGAITANRILNLPVMTGTDTVAVLDLAQTFTNKTINLTSNTLVATSAQLLAALTDETGSGLAVFGTAPTIAGGSITALTTFGLRDTSAAYDVTVAAVSSTTLTAGRILTLDMGNVAHTLALGTTANTITFPNVASDTVVMLAAAQTITGKSIAASQITAGTFAAGTFSFAGSTHTDLGIVTTVDINGGTVDGTNIGASVVGTGAFSSVTATGTITANGQAQLSNNQLIFQNTASIAPIVSKRNAANAGAGFEFHTQNASDVDTVRMSITSGVATAVLTISNSTLVVGAQTIASASGNLASANGVAAFGPAAPASITIVNGIVTAIS